MKIDELISRLQKVREEAGYNVDVEICVDDTEEINIDETEFYYVPADEEEMVSEYIDVRMYLGERAVKKPKKVFHVYRAWENNDVYEDHHSCNTLMRTFFAKEKAEEYIKERFEKRYEEFPYDLEEDDNKILFEKEIPDDYICEREGIRKRTEYRNENMKKKCPVSYMEFFKYKDQSGNWKYDEYETNFIGYYIEKDVVYV